jgi:pilus assembly protein CpaE
MSVSKPVRPSDVTLPFKRAVLIAPQPLVQHAVLESVGGLLQVFESLEPHKYPGAETMLARKPDVCLIDVGSDVDLAMPLIREASEAQIPVIALHTANEPELILRSLRAGANEFFSVPIAAQAFAEALARISRKNGPASKKSTTGKVWVTMPAKPNYGSTTVACNLAVRLNKLEPRRVLLVDMDPLMGSVAFLLGLRNPFSIVDAIADAAHIDNDLWKKLVLKHGGIDILPAPELPRRDDFDCEAVPPLFAFLRDNYAVSIVDSPGPVSAWQLRLAAEADELLLVTTNELAAIHSTKRALQHLEAAGTPRSRLRLVINRYLKENGLSREAIETGLKLDVFHILPNDYEAVQKAIMEGKAVAPDSRLSRSLDELCERMTGFTRASANGWFSGVRQIFGKKTNNAKVSAGGRR